MNGKAKGTEAAFTASFVKSSSQEEWRNLPSRWNRSRPLFRCLREASFDARWQEFEYPWRSASDVIELLKSRGAGPEAYLISLDRKLDRTTRPLEKAVEKCFRSAQATVIVCDPNGLAYFTPGASGRRYVLARPRAGTLAGDPEKRAAVIKQFDRLWEIIQDGSPFSAGFPMEQVPYFLVDEILSAPSDEVDTIIDLLRHPPIDSRDDRGYTEWDYAQTAISTYLIGHLVMFPEKFAPISEELIQHPITGSAFLGALASHYEFYGVPSDPYLPALRVAAEAPWDDDKVLHLLCGLGAAQSPEAVTILQHMWESLGDEPPRHRAGVEQTMENVKRRLAGEESQEFRTELPKMVEEARRRLASRTEF